MSSGTDHRGSYYPSIDSMWQNEINLKNSSNNNSTNNHNLNDAQIVEPIGSVSKWYKKANQYWSSAESTYNGVLNGYGNLSQIDIAGSMRFLRSILAKKASENYIPNRVLDCGAGIGRIAKQMLCSLYKTVDVIDQCEKYIEKSKQILKNQNIGHFYAKGLQEFNFEEKYDCIWVQWVLSHLTDQDAVQFLKKAKCSLNKEGFIVVKQNHSEGAFVVDKDDCSVARSSELYKRIFERANLKVIRQQLQQNWPNDLLDVKMYLLE